MILSDEQVEEIRKMLEEVKAMRGPYAIDQLTHAGNVIESNSVKAKEILKILDEAGKGSG